MTVSNLYPNINPSLLLDFANVRALDPRITFTRASGAVYYDGVSTAKAEENLLLNSQDYSTVWIATNLTPITSKTAPDTTSTATEFTASGGNATLTQSVTAIAADYTFSVWLRRVTGTGDVDISAHSAGTWVTQSITSTWTRFSVTQTLTAGARTPGLRVVTSGDVIEVWGAQLELRAAVTAYTPTTTQPITRHQPVLRSASNNQARLDHDPVSGESLGLLIEEQRTNLALRSEEFNLWTSNPEPNFSLVSVNQQSAPDGTTTADLIIPSTQTGSKFRFRLFTGALSTTYCASVYVKAAGYNFATIQLSNTAFGANAKTVAVDLINGVITSQTAGALGTIQSVGNGWYRISVVATSLATTGNYVMSVGFSPDGSTTQIITGDGVSGIYAWGAQVEVGAFPTSYIKTEASEVTRSTDSAIMTGTNFSSWYRPDEGAVYSEASVIDATVNRGVFSLSDGTLGGVDNEIFHFITFSPSPRVSSTSGDILQTSLSVSGVAAVSNIPIKHAVAYEINNYRSAAQGILGNEALTYTVPTNIDRLHIGARTPNVFVLNGRIKKLAYYPQRLTNTQLQALTR